ncbi:MAG: Hsp70 family protein [Synergistaceae bacterium]|jgi:molecular chaperone DnaK (HSP70)|nr:Hsp70 family protein [Synergistaceae bacterium]
MPVVKNVSAIGVDLGTRNAFCACIDGEGRPVVVPGRWGRLSTPSVVAWDNGWVVGEDAVHLSLRGGRSIWWDIKRKVGSGFRAQCDGRSLAAEELLVPLISALREDAEAFMGVFVSSCVLAVPACFTFVQREALTRAAAAAGLREVRIVNEPTAAALAFGREGRFLVLDFGAGTVDVSVVESEGGVWQVLDSAGSASVGGYDFDLALAEWLRERLSLDPLPPEDPLWRVLVLEAETIKIALSTCRSHAWTPPRLPGRDRSAFQVEREELERMVRFSIRRVVHIVHRLWSRYEPERLLLAGGSARIPLLREILEQEITAPDRMSLCPEDSIAVGAALCTRTGRGRLLLDVLSGDVGFVRDGESTVLIAAGTPLPFSARAVFVPSRPGKATLSIFQDVGDIQPKRTILSVIEPYVAAGEEVAIHCTLDISGLLHLSIGNGRATTDVPLLPPERGSAARPSGRRQRLRELKLRLAAFETLLSPLQQNRLHLLTQRIENIENVGNEDPSIEILERLVSDLEAEL